MERELTTATRRAETPEDQRERDNALLRQELAGMVAGVISHLVGLSEIATMLGVSRQRVGQLVRDYDDFPAPVAELASGRIWETAAVEAWANAHPVRPPGRPSADPTPGETP